MRTWRANGTLPFPRLDPTRIKALDGSLDFPPEGSSLHSQQSGAADAEPADRRRWGVWRSHPTDNR